jgi:transcription elongation factor Elf1
MENTGKHGSGQGQKTSRDTLILPMPEWDCPLCGAESVVQKISRFENILKCKDCDWQRDLNFA